MNALFELVHNALKMTFLEANHNVRCNLWFPKTKKKEFQPTKHRKTFVTQKQRKLSYGSQKTKKSNENNITGAAGWGFCTGGGCRCCCICGWATNVCCTGGCMETFEGGGKIISFLGGSGAFSKKKVYQFLSNFLLNPFFNSNHILLLTYHITSHCILKKNHIIFV